MSSANAPSPYEAILTTVYIAENRGKYDIAEQLLEAAIRAHDDPLHVAHYKGELALVLLAQKKFERAISFADETLQSTPELKTNFPFLYDNLAATREIAAFLASGNDIAEVPFRDHTLLFAISGHNSELEVQHVRGHLYEPDEVALILDHVEDGDRILDIGANVGNHAIAVAATLPGAQVKVFEPVARTVALLRRNVQLNRLENIDMSALGCAIDAEDGTLEVVERINLASSREMIPGIGKTVPKRALRGYWGERVDLMKIDVEGAETRIIRSVLDLVRRDRTKIVLECHKATAEKDLVDLAEMGLDLLAQIERPAVLNILVAPGAA